MKKHIYTEAEKTEITRLYPHCSTKEIARLFGISAASVYNLADRLGLKKSPEYLKKLRSEMSRQLADSGTAHRFPKGHVPANKGRKMNAGVYAKVSATMFKKGHMPTIRFMTVPRVSVKTKTDTGTFMCVSLWGNGYQSMCCYGNRRMARFRKATISFSATAIR